MRIFLVKQPRRNCVISRSLLNWVQWNSLSTFWQFEHSCICKPAYNGCRRNSRGTFKPWTWAIKDRMSLVVCSALKTWCCPLWMGGRWNFCVVLWSNWVRYWSSLSWQTSRIKEINSMDVNVSISTQNTTAHLTITWGSTFVIVIFNSFIFLLLILLLIIL